LTAAKRLLELLTAGRLAQKEPEERKPGCTWEDFKALLREQGTSRLAEQRALRGPVAAGSVCSVRIRLPEPTRCDPASDAERRPGQRWLRAQHPQPALASQASAAKRHALGRDRAGGAPISRSVQRCCEAFPSPANRGKPSGATRSAELARPPPGGRGRGADASRFGPPASQEEAALAIRSAETGRKAPIGPGGTAMYGPRGPCPPLGQPEPAGAMPLGSCGGAGGGGAAIWRPLWPRPVGGAGASGCREAVLRLVARRCRRGGRGAGIGERYELQSADEPGEARPPHGL
jgi:hypothetical protein